MPGTPLTEIVLEKYEANEVRIKEVVQELTNPKCIIKRLLIKQNQFTDKLTEMLAEAII